MDDRAATSHRAACNDTMLATDTVPAAEPHTRPGRLVVVSNRVAFPGSTQTGGLAQALRTALDQRGGLWVGWSGELSAQRGVRGHGQGDNRLLTIDLEAEEFRAYYGRFANCALWPLLHGRSDLVQFDEAAKDAYFAVNRRFADLLAQELRADDTVWVHDYHLLPLGALLRSRGVRCRIGFFLHTPVPPARDLATLPRHRDLVGALASYDLVGVQTAPDAAALAGYLCSELGAAGAGPEGTLVLEDGRRTRIAAFPIGVDVQQLQDEAAMSATSASVQALRQSLDGRALLIGVDRLDYSKGLPERVRAFGRLLERHPGLRGRATLLQIAPESRTELDAYRQLGRDVQRLVGEVNGRFGEVSWTPVRYINRPYAHADLAGFYRLARVGVVTPLRDGMNLVAKEFVASQDPDDPGVLVLSQFAGAAQELDSALLVNPLDTERCADALQRALSMPLAERRLRWRAALQRLRDNDLQHWRESFLAALAASGRSAQSLAVPAPRTASHGDAPTRKGTWRIERPDRRIVFAPAVPAGRVRPGVSA